MARPIAHRVQVVSPAGPLLDQWHTELLERFGLRLDAIDRGRRDEEILGKRPVEPLNFERYYPRDGDPLF